MTIQQKKIVELKAAADKGDKKAQKKWARLSKKVVKLHLKAGKGDLKAAKTLAMLTPTGLFVTQVGPKTLKTTMKGAFVGQTEILGSFVGSDSVTEILGNDQLTEIVTSGGAFVGNDQLAEIITSGWGLSKFAKKSLKAGYKPNPYARKFGALSAAKKAMNVVPSSSNGEEIITSGEFIGEEETALAAEGGACERAALRRRSIRNA